MGDPHNNACDSLVIRRELFKRRRVECDLSLFFATLGLVVIETELYLANIHTKSDLSSLLIKSCVTLSTVTLLGFVLWYHVLDIKLHMWDNSWRDYRMALSNKKIVLIFLELVLCAVHPIPGNHEFHWKVSLSSGVVSSVLVPVDTLISVVMVMRLYLVCRAIKLHSQLFSLTSSQALVTPNHAKINFMFVFKNLMRMYPEYMMTVLVVSVVVVASWLLRTCEMYSDEELSSLLNSLWVIIFLSVGNTDTLPSSYCGRGIALLTAVFGAGCSALLVALLVKKLELSRAEEHVHNFVIDVELDKKLKQAAANVIQAAWLVHRNRKLGRKSVVPRFQRRLLRATHSLRCVKLEQHHLLDASITTDEMFKSQLKIEKQIENIEACQGELQAKLDCVCEKLEAVLSQTKLTTK